jgi:transposase
MDRKAIVQGLYKKLKIRKIATLSKCGLATVQRTKDYLQNHNIPLEEAIEFTESQLQALFDQPHRKPDVFVEEDFAEVFRKVNRVKLRMSLKDCWYQYKKSHEQSSLEVMGYKTYCKRYGEFKEKLDEEAKFQECGRRQWLPGQAVMVDYSGDGLPALIGSEHVELQIFVAVLPYSGYTFAYATPDQTRKSWLHSIREMMTSLQGATKYLILDNSTTCVCQASKVWPKYAKEFEHVCRYYGTIPYAGEPHVPLSKPHVERAVGLVQEKILSQLIDERPAASIKEANERLAEKVRVFNDRPLEIDPSLTRRTLFESKEREFLKQIPAIPWGEDIEVKRLKVQKGGTVRYNQRRYRVNYRYVGEYVNVVACESDQTIRIFTDKKWSLIGELPLKDGTNLTIEDLEKQSSGSRFMQLKAAELIGNIRKAGSNSQALYMQLAGMADELAGARYARFINKRFSELGAEPFEKILEESRDLGAGWDLEELKDKLTNAGKKEIVSIRRRAGQVLQREQRADRNLRGAEHYESILRERKVES